MLSHSFASARFPVWGDNRQSTSCNSFPCLLLFSHLTEALLSITQLKGTSPRL